MLNMLKSLISLWCHYRENTNEVENKQKKESMYPQSYPTNCRYLDVEKWEMCYSLEGEFTSQIHMIMAFDNDSALIMTKDRMVYGLGINYNGRLGLDKDYIQPEKVETLCAKNIKTFYCSTDAKCIFALTEEGEVYSWGSNDNCRLGRKLDSYTDIYIPAKMDSLREERIIDIASNNYNSLALTDSGKIYVWGSVDFTNNSLQDQPLVSQVRMEEIIHIACGTSFVMALTNDGKLYSWGKNKHGQLGISSENDICVYPSLITLLEKVTIVKIVCGWEHSLALTSKGKIYSWGNNVQGQLGHGETCELKKKPTMLIGTAMGIISDIAAQHDASVAVNKLGSVYVWGFLGRNIWKPIRIECSNMYNVFRYEIPHIIHDSTRERSNILRHLETIFDDQLTSDFTIEVEGKCIYVHKFILIRCDYFRNMLQHGWREARENTIKCNDFPYNVYKSFFKCLYTDAVDNLLLEETFELLKLCDKYTEKDVAKKCVEVIKENLNVSNVALCFAIATECNAEDLVESCVQFSLGQMSNIMKSEAFVALSKELLLDFLMRTNDAGVGMGDVQNKIDFNNIDF